jgi:hypothetical protein
MYEAVTGLYPYGHRSIQKSSRRWPSLHPVAAISAPRFPYETLHLCNGFGDAALDLFYRAIDTQTICVGRLGRTPTEKRKQISVVVIFRLVRVNVEITVEWVKICGKKVTSSVDPRHAATCRGQIL